VKPQAAALAILILTLAWGLGSFLLLDGQSFFPGTLTGRPIVWWRVVSWVSVAAIFAGLILAVLVGPAMVHSDRPGWIAAAYLMATMTTIAVGQAGVMFGGVAIFSDRIERRGPLPWSAREALGFDRIRRVEVGCTSGSRRRPRPMYKVVLADGRDEFLGSGFEGPLERDRWLDGVLAVDRAARAGGAERVISRNLFGHPNSDIACLAEVASQFESSRAAEIARILEPAPSPLVRPPS